MKTKKQIKISLMNILKSIKKTPWLFAILFFTQLLFIILVSAIFAKSAIDVGSYSEQLMAPLQGIENTEQVIEAFSDPQFLVEISKSLINAVLMFFLLTYLSYIIINGINWNISNMILERTKGFISYQSMFAALTVIFTLPALLIINISAKLFVDVTAATAFIIMGVVVLLISSYFMYLAFTLINHYEWKNFMKLLKHAYVLGMEKFSKVFPAYIFIILLAVIPLGLVMLAIEAPFIVTIVLLILFVLGINMGRLFFIDYVDRIK